MINEYGLDVSYAKQKLKIVVRDIERYTPTELHRELSRISAGAGKRKCKDGGTCHHRCEANECFREESCVPLSGSGLNDNWQPVEADEEAHF
ncbi:hypothetical protein BOW53_02875 [Solemya pervernicosa gill symbiont]|uniref:Uncharacterized protein n=1 Tax=Solemya pervernicosa gill symbiont TaxID=642797 RepID=A0A1T2L955_9GAMM|nr:hypothetical protein [Solemya pervernicosa gill symbiont]OOZ41639.1 hypothetical protein BOW53_02875 [Solemya pervernicosa gill symbiont]